MDGERSSLLFRGRLEGGLIRIVVGDYGFERVPEARMLGRWHNVDDRGGVGHKDRRIIHSSV